MTESLRKSLEQMTEADTETQYLELFSSAIQNCPRTVVRRDSPHPIGRYTCLVHVFEFTEKPEYISIARIGFTTVFAGPTFAHWLLDNGLLTEISETEAKQGDMVFYFNAEGRIRHAGVYLGGGRVESKWGKGHLFEHDLFAVPETYGVSVMYFRKIPYREGIELFRRFAKEKGMFLD